MNVRVRQALFNVFKREGVELTGSFTAAVDADMRVGALEETVTVTGEAPLVDVQNATKQRVMDHEVLDAVPSGRTATTLGVLIGMNQSYGAWQRPTAILLARFAKISAQIDF